VFASTVLTAIVLTRPDSAGLVPIRDGPIASQRP